MRRRVGIGRTHQYLFVGVHCTNGMNGTTRLTKPQVVLKPKKHFALHSSDDTSVHADTFMCMKWLSWTLPLIKSLISSTLTNFLNFSPSPFLFLSFLFICFSNGNTSVSTERFINLTPFNSLYEIKTIPLKTIPLKTIPLTQKKKLKFREKSFLSVTFIKVLHRILDKIFHRKYRCFHWKVYIGCLLILMSRWVRKWK